jgi:hypothetical protein
MGNSSSQSLQQYSEFNMSMIQSSVSEALFDARTTQTSTQALNVRNLRCTGDLTIEGVNFTNKATTNNTAASSVQQSMVQDATLVQSMAQASAQAVSGFQEPLSRKNQKVKQTMIQNMQAAQYTRSLVSTQCAMDQANEQVVNVENSSANNCTIRDINMDATLESMLQCTQEAVQQSTQTMTLDQSGDQTSTQTITGWDPTMIIIIIIVIFVLFIWAWQGILQSMVPFGFMAVGSGLSAYGIYEVVRYQNEEKTIRKKKDALTAGGCDVTDMLVEARDDFSPALQYWYVTHPVRVYASAAQQFGTVGTIQRVFTNRTMSTQYAVDPQELMTVHNTGIFGSNSSAPVCASGELRYIYTSYDFGGDEVSRCGQGASNDGTGRCNDPGGAAGIMGPGDNRGRAFQNEGEGRKARYKSNLAWRNVFAQQAWTIVTCRRWLDALQDARFGSGGDGRNHEAVQRILQEAVPFFAHHITNDPNDATNFNVMLFVAPYGSDATCGMEWENLGYAPNTCMPHFWMILCFKVDHHRLDQCLLDLGGTPNDLPDAVKDCLSCAGEPDCCAEYKSSVARTRWHDANLTGMYRNEGPRVLQQSAGPAMSGTALPPALLQSRAQLTTQVRDNPATIGALGGYYMPICHPDVDSAAPGCTSAANRTPGAAARRPAASTGGTSPSTTMWAISSAPSGN